MVYYNLNNIIDEIKRHFGKSLVEDQNSLQELVNILTDLIDSPAEAKVKAPQWKYHIQTLAIKIALTSNSIIRLSKGIEVQSFKKSKIKSSIIDYSSLFILTRALIENYVTLSYIYNHKLSEEEKLFRFKLWEVSGLLTRQGFEDPQEYFNKERMKTEGELIKTIFIELEKMDEFKSLDQRKLKKLQKYGLPRIENWHSLIDESNLNQPMFSNMYSFFSEYSHSEYLSILQIGQTSMNKDNPSNIANVQLSLGFVRMIVALTIKFYVTNFKATELVFNTYPSTYIAIVNFWSRIATKSK